MTMDMNKKYKTVDGRAVRIYATDGCSPYQVHGTILQDNGWEISNWNLEGNYRNISKSKYDLVEIWEPQDKELVWCWNDGGFKYSRIVKFYDARYKGTFTKIGGNRFGAKFTHYAKVETEPEWAKEAREGLEK